MSLGCSTNLSFSCFITGLQQFNLSFSSFTSLSYSSNFSFSWFKWILISSSSVERGIGIIHGIPGIFWVYKFSMYMKSLTFNVTFTWLVLILAFSSLRFGSVTLLKAHFWNMNKCCSVGREVSSTSNSKIPVPMLGWNPVGSYTDQLNQQFLCFCIPIVLFEFEINLAYI